MTDRSKRNGKHSIVVNDLYVCVERSERCQGGIETHEVFHGYNRQRSIDDGCVIGLCQYHHARWHSGNNHEDHLMRVKWKRIAQEKWMEHNGKDADGFMKRFRRNYLDAN